MTRQASTCGAAPPPLVEELPPSLTAWEACRRLAFLPHLLFLDSAAPDAHLGRYSFVVADPFAWLWARGREVRLARRHPADRVSQVVLADADPLLILARLLGENVLTPGDDLPPFQGGAAGLLGYDLAHHIERLPRPRLDEFAVPDMAVGLYDWVLAFDHVRQRAWLLSSGLPEAPGPARDRRAEARMSQVLGWLDRPGVSPERSGERIEPRASFPVPGLPGVTSSFRRDDFLAAIARAIEYVHAGDCFQVNVAQRLLHPAHLPPLDLYERLRRRNPAPFAGYFDLGDFVLASASPERFLRVHQGEVETRPIKGTRPRGQTPEEDARHAADLLGSAKDRAENVMIVDLLRNDLGRVCRYGSVEVSALCRLESFRYVHHLVSEVRGRLRPDRGLVDLLRASFPGGSVTGAPKVRAMEIIAELEPTARGPYCGSLGYLGFDGAMDTSILIRTITAGKGWLQLPVGGGIVADSEPESEYAETLHKAEGLLRAIHDGEGT